MQTYGTTAQFDAPSEMTGQSCFAGPDLLIDAQVKTTGVYCWWLPSQPPFLFPFRHLNGGTEPCRAKHIDLTYGRHGSSRWFSPKNCGLPAMLDIQRLVVIITLPDAHNSYGRLYVYPCIYIYNMHIYISLDIPDLWNLHYIPIKRPIPLKIPIENPHWKSPLKIPIEKHHWKTPLKIPIENPHWKSPLKIP